MRQTLLRKAPSVRRRILILTVFLTPLFFLPSAYNAFNVPKLWLIMVSVTIVAAIRCIEILQGADRTGLDLLVVPGASVAAALTIGTVFSPYRVWAVIGDHSRFTGLLPYLVVILFGVLVADAFRGDVHALAAALVASAAVASLYAVVQVLGLDPFEWSESAQATVTIGNTNFSGAFFAISLPLAVGVFLVETERRVEASTGLFLVLVGWVVTRSELAWAAGAAALLILTGILVSERWKPARVVGFAGAASIAIAGIALVLLAFGDEDPAYIPQTIDRRAEWWDASLEVVAESPVVGRGPNAFAVEHSHHRDAEDVAAASFGVTDDPHSVPLAFLTAAGIFGIAGFAVFAGWIILQAIRTRPDQPLAAASVAASGAYLVQAMLSVDVVTLRFVAWTVVGGMAAALAAKVPQARKPFTNRSKKKKRRSSGAPEPLKALPAVVAVVLLASAGFAWASGFLAADIRFRRGLSYALGGVPGAKENLERAVKFRDSNYTYRTQYGSILGSNAVREAESDDGDRQVARDLLHETKTAFSFTDQFPHVNLVLEYARTMRGWAEVDPSAEDEALALFSRAQRLDPHNYLLVEEYALAATSFGRQELAQELTAEAQELRASAGA